MVWLTMMLGIAQMAASATAPMAGMAMPEQPPCPRAPAALPAELAGWRAMTPLQAGANAAAAPMLAVGRAARAALLATPTLHYPVAPAHAGGAATRGGLLAFTVAAPGRYRVALGAAAWIDVVDGASAVPSVAHGHGPACSGVRKTVDFDLKPGRYLLQIAGNAEPAVGVMIVRLPG